MTNCIEDLLFLFTVVQESDHSTIYNDELKIIGSKIDHYLDAISTKETYPRRNHKKSHSVHLNTFKSIIARYTYHKILNCPERPIFYLDLLDYGFEYRINTN